ncbi:MAG: aminotransferase class I/II-fold pyridoxal phosphate-dependent enzyme [Lachnospiraceae bacterium]|nr:aminotransferase class I/II-fold pyridoxal phosphate-dependent enzyme [Lachnospiraceae bacterium]
MRKLTNEEREKQSRMPILAMTKEFVEQNRGYFCIPGHRFERGMNPALREQYGEGLFRYDLTETDHLDDLHHAEGPILEAQQLAAQLFGSDRCFFLVNGTTCGNEAMILTAVSPGEKILIARNAHKSVTMGLILSGAVPVWMEPEMDEEWGFAGEILPETVERHLKEQPDCKAVFLVSPTYYGTCSDLRKIGEVCHRHGVPLLVDEAHGSHLYFHSSCPEGAMEAGADACVQSTHKTLGSLTQTSMLHMQGTLLDQERMDENLKLVMSTSPSYVFMAAMDAARQQMAMEGEVLLDRALRLADRLRHAVSSMHGYRLLQGKRLDPLRVVISGKPMGLTGEELQGLLFQKGRISLEMADPVSVVLVLTWGNTEAEISYLIEVLRLIQEEQTAGTFEDRKQIFKLNSVRPGAELADQLDLYRRRSKWNEEFRSAEIKHTAKLPSPEVVLSPRDAYYAKKESVPMENAAGRIAGELIAPYPPGIPAVCPGERLTDALIRYLKDCAARNCRLHGPADETLETIRVLR